MHATRPNEVIHFDFLTMPTSATGINYLLVVKDDMSGYVELVECEAATADAVCAALVDWFKRFGVVQQWVSDRGTHFKNQVVDQLRKALLAQHHFVLAYCPWANGTVEVVNRLVLRCFKALMSELKLPIDMWTSVTPLVQATLNMMPSNRLNGVAPVTAFTQLPATTPLTTMMHPRTKRDVTLDWVKEQQGAHVREVAAALDNMHKAYASAAEEKREQARQRRAGQRGVMLPKFAEGDFVLVGQVLSKANKLALAWRGPRRIVRALNDFTFEVEDLCAPFAVTAHHASRLKAYADASRGVTEDLVAQAVHGDGGHLVEEFRASRVGAGGHHEVQVKWIGLDEEEVSWEPASALYADVPVLLERYVKAHPENEQVQRMWLAVNPPSRASKAKTKGGK